MPRDRPGTRAERPRDPNRFGGTPRWPAGRLPPGPGVGPPRSHLMPQHVTLADLEATPHALVFERPAPKTIRLALDAGDSVPAHSHPGEDVVLHLVEGRLELDLDDETYDLAAGDLVRFAGEREVSPTAVEDSVAVIVFSARVD